MYCVSTATSPTLWAKTLTMLKHLRTLIMMHWSKTSWMWWLLRKIGGPQITAIMVLSSSVWHGTVQEPIVPPMVVVAPVLVCSVSLHWIAGLITPTSIKRVCCCGPSNRNTVKPFLGPIWWFWQVTAPWNRWVWKPSVSVAVEPMFGNLKPFIGVLSVNGWPTSDTKAIANWKIRWLRFKWDWFMLTLRALMATPTPLHQHATFVRPSSAWRWMITKRWLWSLVDIHSVKHTVRQILASTLDQSLQGRISLCKAWDGKTVSAQETVVTPSPVDWKALGPQPQPSGAITISKTCSATSGN